MRQSKKESRQSAGTVPIKSVELSNQYGKIFIYDTVLMDVVKKAACAVPGVSRLAGGTFVDNIASIITSKRVTDKVIRIELIGTSLTIEVKINVIYGKNIPEIAVCVQNTITDEVKQITGMEVTRVDVIIQEIDNIPNEEEFEKE